MFISVWACACLCLCACGSKVIYFTAYSFVGKRYFILSVFEKVNALTFKLKTHLGEVGGQEQCAKGEEEKKEEEE